MGGWTYQDGGVNRNFQIFESRPFQYILEAGLLKEEVTQLAWVSWARLGEWGGNLLPIFL